MRMIPKSAATKEKTTTTKLIENVGLGQTTWDHGSTFQ
jgi:hypothetical protein